MLRRTRNLFTAAAAVAVAGLAVGCGGGGGSNSSVGGGSGGGSTAQGSFVTVGSLASGRKGHSATLIPSTGQVLIAGGLARAGTADVAVETAEIFDPATGRFIPVQRRMTTPRAHHAAAVSAIGNVILAGGQSDAQSSTVHQSVEVYNAVSGTFSTATALGQAVSEATAFVYPWQGAERFAVVGGRTNASTATNRGYLYTADSSPSQAGIANIANARYGAKAVAVDANGSKVLLQGGLTNALEVFDAASGTFSSAGQLLQNRFGASLARLGSSDRVAIIGGRSNVATSSAADATIAIYDGTTGLVQTAVETLATARSEAACVSLSNGDVLVVGGISSTGQVLNTTEIISGTGTDLSVRQGPNMTVARRGHTATLLNNGTILIAGGCDQNGTPLASAEVFALKGANVPVPTIPSGSLAPQIASINPTQGPIATQVTISCSNITTNTNDIVVKFGNLLAPAQSAVQNNAGSVDITTLVPQNAVSGLVTVANAAGQVSNGVQFTVTTGSGGGGSGSGNGNFGGAQPRLWIILPSSAGSFIPVGFGGANFDNPTTPYFTPSGSSNPVASVSLFNWGIRNIPLIGSISIGFTITPPALQSGPATVEVDYFGMRSNAMSFTKR
jgi:hypothetical protein